MKMKSFLGLEKVDAKLVVRNVILIAFGALVCAVGINAFLIPHKFLSGGVSGLSQFLSYFTPVSVGLYVALFNIPVFVVGWLYVGRSFVIGSIVGVMAFSTALISTSWMAKAGWAPEPLLSAIMGGALSGSGTGLVFRANSSLGGTDILSAAVKRRWSLSIGTVNFFFNVIIVAALGLKYGLSAALYTIIAQFCSSLVQDKVIVGLDTSMAVFIISSEPQKIADQIMKQLNRGVTFLDGEGAYLGKKEQVIYCVVTLSQIARVKHYVRTADPKAFLTIAEVSEVLGKGFRKAPV